MKNIVKYLLSDRSRTIPVISYPLKSVLGCSVVDMVTDSQIQTQAMKYLSDNYPVGAVLNMMDLSVEAEAFGAEIRYSHTSVPEVVGTVISDIEEIDSIIVPPTETQRTSVFAKGIQNASKCISLPLICGVAGPFSLAGRLLNLSELMISCFEYPDEIKSLLDITTSFIINYINLLKSSGAKGVLVCEPSAGLLSPDMAEEFSNIYIKRIFNSVNDNDFILGYHNCGASVNKMPEQIAKLGADFYHFGNAINIESVIPYFDAESIVMGNIDPMLFKNGAADDIRNAVSTLRRTCYRFPNFMVSTGCDLPSEVPLENINAYFDALKEL